jgi:hypothetical protein
MGTWESVWEDSQTIGTKWNKGEHEVPKREANTNVVHLLISEIKMSA